MMRFLRKNRRLNLGELAEKHAARFLKQQGLVLVQRNYHSRFGEIDLIMREGSTWVFVEVRCRAENAPVTAVESITAQKMHKIRKTAEHYMMQFDEVPDCRFDVIALSHRNHHISDNINWIQNAG